MYKHINKERYITDEDYNKLSSVTKMFYKKIYPNFNNCTSKEIKKTSKKK